MKRSETQNTPRNSHQNHKYTVLAIVLALGLGWEGLASKIPPSSIPSVSLGMAGLTLQNWGLSNANSRSHIAVLDAWKIETGKSQVVVAVIDTGIDPSHADLKTNLWQGRDKKTHAPIYGWDFTTNRPNPKDEHSHGTHVAGIIGATLNRDAGTAGVAQHVSIMPLKYYAPKNSGAVNLTNSIKALNYAIDNGARIINYSGGGPEYSQEEYLAIKRAEANNVLIVCAAGNDRHNTDVMENRYYPAAYRTSNVLSVGAIDIQGKLISSSNWGKNSVDVVAPGENIYSTVPELSRRPAKNLDKNGKYDYMTGTSQATAFVSGIAALLLAKDPSLTPVQIRKIVMETVDVFPELSTKIASSGKVNAYSALLKLQHLKDGFNKAILPTRIGQEPDTLFRVIANQ